MRNRLEEITIKKDFEMIVHKFGRDIDHINVYTLGDLHIGSSEFSFAQWGIWKQKVLDDPNGYVVILGDLMDNGLKNSKTDCFGATMRPREQKEWLAQELMPLKDRILCITRGNHEKRSADLSDECPIYDVACKLGIEDLYRENMCFVKVSLGEKRSDRQYSYGIAVGHGASRGKTKNFSYAIDSMDVFFTGHTHQPEESYPAKIVMDLRNETVTQVGFVHITVPSFLEMGGYALAGMYMPTDFRRIPYVTLSGVGKNVDVHNLGGMF